MFAFSIAAAVLAAGAGALMLWRGARAAQIAAGPDPTLSVYRRALEEADDLARRGLTGAEERDASRAEAGRRLLAASGDAVIAPSTRLSSAALLAATLPPLASAMALYLFLGAPGMKDEPFAARLAFWRAHPEQADGPALAAVLKAFAAERPTDPEPLRRLAAIDVSMGDPSGAAHALHQALTIAPGRPDLLEPLGEILVLENGGKVNAEAEALFQQASLRDPSSATIRYYRGRARIEAGDAQAGLAIWKDLLAGLPAADPRRALLELDIDSVEKTGQPSPPEDASPKSGAVSGAIQGMVDGLAARLQAHPDDAQGWVRLVRAYTVLGDFAKRDAALNRARTLFVTQPQVLSALNAATARP